MNVAAQYHIPLHWIDSQFAHMVHLTEGWSRINSGSANLDGLAQQLQVLEDNFHWLGGQSERIDLAPWQQWDDKGNPVNKQLGQALRIRKRPEVKLQVFLCGHMDTVYGIDHPFQEPRFLDEDTLNGPGVADLKGGLVVMLKALEAFERSEWAENLGWEVLINPDEEIGSPGSDALLKEAAGRNHVGLIYEPSYDEQGTLAGARRGSGNFQLFVQGKAAHVGRAFNEGRNAIAGLAELAVALHGLNGTREGVTVNVGRISGGGALNVVPETAGLGVNVRTQKPEDEAWFDEKIQKLIDSFHKRNDMRATWHGRYTRPPRPLDSSHERLFSTVIDSANHLGQAISHRPSGGCCDGNNLSAYGLPNVDTLGVRGGAIHSDKEYVKLASLAERAKLSAYCLMRWASGEIKI